MYINVNGNLLKLFHAYDFNAFFVSLYNFYTPRKLCLWEGILFSRCPTDRPSECASVTFCFLIILENH